jgi:hypothetical protein
MESERKKGAGHTACLPVGWRSNHRKRYFLLGPKGPALHHQIRLYRASLRCQRLRTQARSLLSAGANRSIQICGKCEAYSEPPQGESRLALTLEALFSGFTILGLMGNLVIDCVNTSM